MDISVAEVLTDQQTAILLLIVRDVRVLPSYDEEVSKHVHLLYARRVWWNKFELFYCVLRSTQPPTLSGTGKMSSSLRATG